MALTSAEFFCFLGILFPFYWLAAGRRNLLKALISAVNLFFYWRWSPQYLAIMPAAALFDYFAGRAIHLAGPGTKRRVLMACSVAVNLGLVVLTRVHGGEWPVGLSFYAFQALTYTADIARGDARPAPGVLSHFASVLFFPTVLAGPIARVSALIPQWDRVETPLSNANGGHGLFLIGAGAAKKFLIADYLANNLVERVFDTPTLYSGLEVLAGIYGYAFQLYYDFSGYTDIALGAALLLGIKLPANFNRPYEAANVADFWRRWHMSLSNWLRDYLYFSLPGQRSKWGQYANLVITMLLGGVWHGFHWTFAVWGGLHGLALAVTRAWQTRRRGAKPGRLVRFGTAFATFHFVAFCWIFFRASSLPAAFEILGQLASLSTAHGNISSGFLLILAVAAVCQYLPRGWYDAVRRGFTASPAIAQAAALVLLAVSIQYTVSTGAAPFIYQRF